MGGLLNEDIEQLNRYLNSTCLESTLIRSDHKHKHKPIETQAHTHTHTHTHTLFSPVTITHMTVEERGRIPTGGFSVVIPREKPAVMSGQCATARKRK